MDIVPLKCCSTCKQEKPATLFFHKSSSHDHLTSQCKQCILQHQREQRGRLPIPPEGLKRCRTCKEVKPATPEFFHRGPSGKDGLRGTCKACRIQTSKEEYRKYALHRTEEQKERRRQYREQYRETHKERIQQRGRDFSRQYYWEHKQNRQQYYQDHREHYQEYHRHHRKTHSEELKAYHEAHRQHINTRSHLWRQSHQAQVQEYRKTHREQDRAYVHKRRAHKMSQGGSYTTQDIERKFRAQKKKCYYCHKPLSHYHIEHVVPLSRGGSNAPDNVVLACPSCNNSKHARLPHEWPKGGRLL